MMLLDFQKARNEAFTLVASMCDATRSAENRGGDKKYIELWNIEDHLDVLGKLVPLSLTVKLAFDFPLTLPKIYVKNKSLGFLPHIDTNGFICTFDEANTII